MGRTDNRKWEVLAEGKKRERKEGMEWGRKDGKGEGNGLEEEEEEGIYAKPVFHRCLLL